MRMRTVVGDHHAMAPPSSAGRWIQIVCGETDVTIEIEPDEDDASVARALLDALDHGDIDEVEQALRSNLSAVATVSRRG